MIKQSLIAIFSLVAVSCTNTHKMKADTASRPQKTEVVAHRGAWKHTGYPQNSVGAWKAAIEMGCYGSEMDVHMTADGFIVVNHDPDFHGVDIQSSSLADLRKFRLSNGDDLPLLGDFLREMVKGQKTKLIIEIKPSVRGKEWALQTAETVTREVEKFGAGSQVEFISFDFDICKEVARILPTAKVQYLNGNKTPDEVKDAGLTGIDYHYSVFRKYPDYFKKSRRLGLTTNVWTVNEAAEMDWLIEQKADFITTDEPELLIEKLK